jgi:hypothetical protein
MGVFRIFERGNGHEFPRDSTANGGELPTKHKKHGRHEIEKLRTERVRNPRKTRIRCFGVFRVFRGPHLGASAASGSAPTDGFRDCVGGRGFFMLAGC